MGRFKVFARMLSMVLVFSIATNLAGKNLAAVAVSEVYSEINSVYVDGVEYLYKLTLDEGITIKTADGSVELTIDNYGNGIAKVEEFGEEKEYQLEINDLSTEKVDVEIKDEDGFLVEKFDNVDDIVKDDYVGQVAGTITIAVISISTLLEILITVLATVVIGTVTYYAVTTAISAIQNSSGVYFPAYRGSLSSNNVVIAVVPLTWASAVGRVTNGGDIYTLAESSATTLIASGAGLSYVRHNEHITNCAPNGKVYFKHLHPVPQPSAGCHVWFGSPYTHD